MNSQDGPKLLVLLAPPVSTAVADVSSYRDGDILGKVMIMPTATMRMVTMRMQHTIDVSCLSPHHRPYSINAFNIQAFPSSVSGCRPRTNILLRNEHSRTARTDTLILQEFAEYMR